MSIYDIIDENQYAATAAYFVGKKAIEREERYLQFIYNSVYRYQKDTNVSFLNNIFLSARIAGKMRVVKKLLDAVKLHNFDKESGKFISDGKLDEKRLKNLRENWELIFEEWLQGEIKAERKASEFSEESAARQLYSLIHKLEEKLGMSDEMAKAWILSKLST